MEGLSCVFCKGEIPVGTVGAELSGFTNKIYVYIEKDKLRVFGEAPNDAAGYITINYCPICGRKLRQKTSLYNKSLAIAKSNILSLPI